VTERLAAEVKGGSQERLLTAQRNALVGYTKIDLFGGVTFQFGLVNNRPINDREVNTLIRNFMQNGVIRFSEATAIPLVLPKNFYNPASVSKEVKYGDDLGMIEWTPEAIAAKGIEAAGGRHRFEAITRWKDRDIRDLKTANEALAQAKQGKGNDETPGQDLIPVIEDRIKKCGYWMAFVYDHRERPSVC
jgi:hypothetical protein